MAAPGISSKQADAAVEEITPKALATQVMQLAGVVRAHTKRLVEHGEDIMRIDARAVGLDSKTGAPVIASSGGSGGVDESVLGELVQELQTKLDELEERSIRRTANTHLSRPGDVIDWMPGPDPEQQDLPAFLPETLGAFESIEVKALLECMKYYGLAHYEEGMELPNQEEYITLYNECSRFLGLRSRKRA
ncbi:hypothetical protein BCR37DRAFT_5274 [Protomyces lactucae-debilis]|uniref:Uncharacterized protein n=1 Tax=Protomyces lactucae-debilis TaxID=2754530 RepID=A0A1Y2FUP9_PROLT|nr:uncharacterized protein BCR37DRAFT_5274 [Protomyces lactucae-debilis]ORY87679.1 hypothetical protein BCR37DRAFT_5274 [Protomyces lactucae-debilis]